MFLLVVYMLIDDAIRNVNAVSLEATVLFGQIRVYMKELKSSTQNMNIYYNLLERGYYQMHSFQLLCKENQTFYTSYTKECNSVL